MTTQPLALQLAKDFDACAGTLPDRFYFEAAIELRRLHEVNQYLLNLLDQATGYTGCESLSPTLTTEIKEALAKAKWVQP